MIDLFENWTGAKFEYLFNTLDSNVYKGSYTEIDLDIFLMEKFGLGVGVKVLVTERPTVDRVKQTTFIDQVLTYFVGSEARDWVSSHRPREIDELAANYYEVEKGTIVILVKQVDAESYFISLVDTEYAD